MNCECCGKPVESRDSFALHTSCMKNHSAHLDGERSSRCKSGVKRTSAPYQRLPEDFEGNYERLTSGAFDDYFAEAKMLRLSAGIQRSGVFGAACPKCYRQMRSRPLAQTIITDDLWCYCQEYLAHEEEEFALFGQRVKRVERSTFTAV